MIKLCTFQEVNIEDLQPQYISQLERVWEGGKQKGTSCCQWRVLCELEHGTSPNALSHHQIPFIVFHYFMEEYCNKARKFGSNDLNVRLHKPD